MFAAFKLISMNCKEGPFHTGDLQRSLHCFLSQFIAIFQTIQMTIVTLPNIQHHIGAVTNTYLLITHVSQFFHV